jgi:hypothetical protein
MILKWGGCVSMERDCRLPGKHGARETGPRGYYGCPAFAGNGNMAGFCKASNFKGSPV